jgi:hypothetical protein
VSIDFVDLKPPELDVPLIELESTDGEIIDLYNEHSLRAVVLDERGLTFEFVSKHSRRVDVRFSAVRNLRVEQPADWVQEEATQIEHLLIRMEGPWPQVLFKAGGLEYEFDCSTLRLALDEH